MNDQVKRYDPAEVLTDRWEMGGMDEVADGDYVRWDDYDVLHAEVEALQFELKELFKAAEFFHDVVYTLGKTGKRKADIHSADQWATHIATIARAKGGKDL